MSVYGLVTSTMCPRARSARARPVFLIHSAFHRRASLTQLAMAACAADTGSDGETASASPCAAHQTVVASFATSEFNPSLAALSLSVTRAGFPCLVSLRGVWAPAAGCVRYLESGVELFPRAEWCDHNVSGGDHRTYGWRLTHLFKPRLWRVVLNQGFNMLYLDANYRLLGDPSPAILALGYDVVGGRDVGIHQLGHINIGRLWLRATNGTRELARRVENRSWGSWDQFIFNEELDWNDNVSSIRCCHGGDSPHLPCTRSMLIDAGRPSSARVSEHRCTPNKGAVPFAAWPPAQSRYRWSHGVRRINRSWVPQLGWEPQSYNQPPSGTNVRGLHAAHYAGRCSGLANTCPTCIASSTAPSDDRLRQFPSHSKPPPPNAHPATSTLPPMPLLGIMVTRGSAFIIRPWLQRHAPLFELLAILDGSPPGSMAANWTRTNCAQYSNCRYLLEADAKLPVVTDQSTRSACTQLLQRELGQSIDHRWLLLAHPDEFYLQDVRKIVTWLEQTSPKVNAVSMRVVYAMPTPDEHEAITAHSESEDGIKAFEIINRVTHADANYSRDFEEVCF